MAFLSPYLLFGVLAAGIPVALHFFFRSRYRTVPWAAMKFLLASIEQTSRRLRFQELLLLIVRCLVLAVLALALARPLASVVRGEGGGDAVDAVFVFDVSYSMGASDGAVDRLERAKAAALEVIEQLPVHSTVQIITCADRKTLLGPRSPANLDQARDLIKDLRLTSLAGDLHPGIVEAEEVLRRGQATNKELYLFTDMQKLGWEQQSANVVAKLTEIRDKAAIFLVRCGDPQRKLGNAAIVGITPQISVPRPGDRVGFAVLVRNTGNEEIKEIALTLSVDGDQKKAETQTIKDLRPGATRAVTLAAKLDKPGLRVLTAQLGHDDLPGDNRLDQVLLVRDQVNVLVIDGAIDLQEPRNSSSYYLGHALIPVLETLWPTHYLQHKVYAPSLVSPGLLAKQDLCILVNVPLESAWKRTEALPPDFLDALEKFVRQGKALLIYAGDHVHAEPYNRLLGAKHRLLPLPLKGFAEFPRATEQLVKVNRDSVGLPAYAVIKEDGFYKVLAEAPIFKAVEVVESAKAAKANADDVKASADVATVALRFSNGLPAVVTKKVGGGEVVFVATSAHPGFQKDSADRAWSEWPENLANTPFVQITLSHLLQGQSQTYNLTAGVQFDWQLPGELGAETYLKVLKTLAPDLTGEEERTLLKQSPSLMGQNFRLKTPDGGETRLGYPERREQQLVVPLTDLNTAGIYRLGFSRTGQIAIDDILEKKAGMPIAVTPDLRDSDNLETFSDEQLDQRLGFRPFHMTAGASLGASGADRLAREWTLWLLTLVLVLVAFESVLAWWCGKAW